MTINVILIYGSFSNLCKVFQEKLQQFHVKKYTSAALFPWYDGKAVLKWMDIIISRISR